MKGQAVDSSTVNGLILGGIINIIVQHDTIEELTAKVKDLEIENLTNRTRLESLETWSNVQSGRIETLNKQLERVDKNGVLVNENDELDLITKKLINLEVEIQSLKKGNINKSKNQRERFRSTCGSSASTHKHKCYLCEIIFEKNCDLELHLAESHEEEKTFKCNDCEKWFYLEWRCKQHMKIHTSEVKYCYFFNNDKNCPYEEIGCMFLHESAEMCTFSPCRNNLCQYKHEKVIETIEDKIEEGNVDSDEEYQPVAENQCHLCREQFENYDILIDHMERNHTDYYYGMLEMMKQTIN